MIKTSLLKSQQVLVYVDQKSFDFYLVLIQKKFL